MVLGLGLDVVELDRIARGLERFGQRYLEKILHPGELALLPHRPTAFVAARFAAKEAAAKALGTGFSHGVAAPTIEIRGGERGKPELVFHGPALEAARALGVRRCLVSLTHGRDVAAAVVVLED